MNPSLWHDMFALGLPVVEKIVRPIIVYVALIVGLRIAGKRELAQLNTFDLVVLMMLSNTVQNAIIGDDNTVTGGLLGAAALLAVNYVVIRLLYDHPGVERVVEGGEDVLIEKGILREDRLREELITREQLEAAAHRQGFGSLADVERAVLEPEGAIAFLGKQPGPEDARHRELMRRLDAIQAELSAMRVREPA
jgi:uncharacterized membrane protein YcaP (DUF421 family)